MPTLLGADGSVLLPTTLENHAWIDLYSVYEKYDLQNIPRSVIWDDLFFREKLTFETAGFFYHPRFLRYRIQVAGALDQETYDETGLFSAARHRGSAFEYDARLFLLPEHPYNLELFATRLEPLFRQESAIQPLSLSMTQGADVRYRDRPWFFHARAEDDELEYQGATTDIKRLALDGKYFKDFGNDKLVSFDASFIPTRSSSTNGYKEDNTDVALGSTLTSGPYSFYSNLTRSGLSQEGGATTVQTDSSLLSWYEQFVALLPWRFRFELYWRYYDNRSEYGGTSGPTPTAFSNVNRNVEAQLKHQLYDSLQSYYILQWSSGDSGGGETTALDNSLTFNYTKQVPDLSGRLTLGLNLGLGDVRNSGQNDAADELHPGITVPGSFLLGHAGADPRSLVVLVRSPAPPYDLVLLTENVNYMVSTLGNSLEVTILALPVPFLVPGTFDFQVSYSFLSGNYDATTRTFGQSGSLALWNNLVTPYYSYNSVRWNTLSGTAPGGGLNADTFIGGVSFFRGPLRGRVEYEDVTWATSPWHGWRGEVQYVGPLSETTNLNATASYQDQIFGASSLGGGVPPYTQKTTSAFGTVQQFLFSRRLSVSAGGSYTRILGLSDSRTYTLNGSLSLKLGKLEIVGGASYTGNESQGGTVYAGRSTHQYYYLTLRRYLF